jgi:hypothetical protein
MVTIKPQTLAATELISQLFNARCAFVNAYGREPVGVVLGPVEHLLLTHYLADQVVHRPELDAPAAVSSWHGLPLHLMSNRGFYMLAPLDMAAPLAVDLYNVGTYSSSPPYSVS